MSTVSRRSRPPSRSASDPQGVLVGRALRAVCFLDEPVLRACSSVLSAIPSSRKMQNRLSEIDDLILKRNFSHFGSKRPCFMTSRIAGSDEVEVVLMATFDDQPIESIDQLSQFYAFSFGPTPPWPSVDSPVVDTTPPWPRSPNYLIAQQFRVKKNRLQGRWDAGKDYRLPDISVVELLCDMKRLETIRLPRSQVKEMVRDWDKKHDEFLEKSGGQKSRGKRKGSKNSVQTEPPHRHTKCETSLAGMGTILEDDEPANAPVANLTHPAESPTRRAPQQAPVTATASFTAQDIETKARQKRRAVKTLKQVFRVGVLSNRTVA